MRAREGQRRRLASAGSGGSSVAVPRGVLILAQAGLRPHKLQGNRLARPQLPAWAVNAVGSTSLGASGGTADGGAGTCNGGWSKTLSAPRSPYLPLPGSASVLCSDCHGRHPLCARACVHPRLPHRFQGKLV